MSREDDVTQEVAIEELKLSPAVKGEVLTYFRDRQAAREEQKKRLDRLLSSNAWVRSSTMAETLATEMQKYSIICDEVERLTRMLYLAGTKGEM